MSTVAVEEDEPIQAGDLIGYTGDTGCDINTLHLHQEYYVNNDGGLNINYGSIKRKYAYNPLYLYCYHQQPATFNIYKESNQVIWLEVNQDGDSMDVVKLELTFKGGTSSGHGDILTIDLQRKIGINPNDEESEYMGVQFYASYFNENHATHTSYYRIEGDWSGLSAVDVSARHAHHHVTTDSITTFPS